MKRDQRLLAALGVGIGLSAWWLLPPADSLVLPPLPAVLGSMIRLAASGELVGDAAASMARILAGTSAAALLATVLGGLALACRPVVALTAGVTEVLRPIPPLAWIPVAILAFGIGSEAAVAIVATAAFFPIWLGVVAGLASVDPQLLMVARSLGAGRRLTALAVELPSMRPHLAHGLRLGVGNGWISVIAAEMAGAGSGLGHAVQARSLNIQMDAVYAYLLTIGVLGVLTSRLMDGLVRRYGGAS